MKFWQLVSVCRWTGNELGNALKDQRWNNYYDAYLNFGDIVIQQRRDILDEVVPDDLVVSILQNDPTLLYISLDHIRTRPLGIKNETSITILSAYQRIGGEILEDAFEKGSVRITDA